MQVDLFKKISTYKKDGEDKTATNFYVKCGDTLVPIEVRFFENNEGKDPNYSGRKLVLSSFAALLPDKPKQDKKAKGTIPDLSNLQEVAEEDNSF